MGKSSRTLHQQMIGVLVEACKEQFSAFVESGFLPESNMEAVRNTIFQNVDLGIWRFIDVQGEMERRTSSGSVTYHVYNRLKEDLIVFELDDEIKIGDKEYTVGLDKGRPILVGDGNYDKYSLRSFLLEKVDYIRFDTQPDMSFVNFLNSLDPGVIVWASA
ncbi:MAG: hypothetical protein KAS32_20030 [Candidatus Peribacteraceae bacterium]|nr:hypothetical protein [Candidatus Peribacteraceae bacterium]